VDPLFIGYCKEWMENEDYKTAVRSALKSSTKLQRDIADAFLEKPHRFQHKELAARLGIAPGTLNGQFGRLGHHVYEILQRRLHSGAFMTCILEVPKQIGRQRSGFATTINSVGFQARCRMLPTGFLKILTSPKIL
jgi:hypothetical protein